MRCIQMYTFYVKFDFGRNVIEPFFVIGVPEKVMNNLVLSGGLLILMAQNKTMVQLLVLLEKLQHVYSVCNDPRERSTI